MAALGPLHVAMFSMPGGGSSYHHHCFPRPTFHLTSNNTLQQAGHYQYPCSCFLDSFFGSEECLKSKIDRGSKEKSHLERHLRLRNHGMDSHESGD